MSFSDYLVLKENVFSSHYDVLRHFILSQKIMLFFIVLTSSADKFSCLDVKKETNPFALILLLISSVFFLFLILLTSLVFCRWQEN